MIAGGLAADGATFSGTTVFTQAELLQDGAVGVAIDSDVLSVHNDYIFGWQEIGPVMNVTKSNKNVVYEINGKSAYDIYAYYLGENAAKKLPAIGIEFPLIIQKNGVRVARAVLNINDDGSLVFAGNIKEGQKVQLGFGNVEEILKTTEKYKSQLSHIESIFIYSCMARRRFLQYDIATELDLYTDKNIPVSGFFTNGEFFKNKKSCELLNQTMTTIALSENVLNGTLVEDNNTNLKSRRKDNYMSDTMVALTHLVNVTSKELVKSNQDLQINVDNKTLQLEEKIIELKQATKTKSNFLANMSHEIRTPLNAIIGFIDILHESESDEEKKNYLEITKTSSESLLTIINDILDFSKMESGNLVMESIDFDLKKLIREIGLLFFESAKEKDIHLKIHFDSDVPHFINGDPIRFKQVATNLISNAIKFTHRDGEVRMNVDYDKENNLLRFEVKDTGVGIAHENLEKIFKPFSQEDSTITRKFGGTGLGLTISYDLVKLMGSELKVTSELGIGSSFYFLLPLNLNVKSEQITKRITKGNLEKILEAKILLVEDNEANQIFMKIILKRWD